MESLVKPLVLRDEIHGDMAFDRSLRPVIDHECFQRLRYIKQIGLAEYLFPCATHTRFQHSLGAAFLAGQYFQNMLEASRTNPFWFDGKVGDTTFYAERTLKTIQAVADHAPSCQFWHRVAVLSAMLHDVGHGPWSHLFETLNLEQDFSSLIQRMSGAIRAYFDNIQAQGRKLWHEEISLLYIFHILHGVFSGAKPGAGLYFVTVASLVNRKIALGKFQAQVEKEIASGLAAAGLQGGVDFHKLLRPLISGPFDVDRMDYIQRDARNAGVHIGGIEWPRIMQKLMPCLADHENQRGEPRDVVLVSHLKNQHVLDDFIFSLFQMYAQVYMHPKIVGFEESIRQIFSREMPQRKDFVVTFDVHRSLTDERFRAMLRAEFGIEAVDAMLFRRPGARFKIEGRPADAPLKGVGFVELSTQDRPMMKDSVGVFLYSTEDNFIRPWAEVSPIARQFHSIHHAPRYWVRPQ